jgi:HEAT repeat protein
VLDSFYWALLLAAGAIPFLAIRGRDLERNRREWRKAAREMGLHFTPARGLSIGAIEGTIGQVVVRIQHAGLTESDSVEYAVELPGIPRGLGLSKRSSFGPNIPTGDSALDTLASAYGSVYSILAALRPEARRILISAYRQIDVRVDQGIVSTCVRPHQMGATRIEALVRLLMNVASALVLQKETEIAQMIANIEEESNPNVALEILETIFDEDARFTTAAAHAGLKHTDTRVRSLAASRLGKEGNDAMLAILENAALGAWLRTQALDHLTIHSERAVLEPFVAAFAKTAPTELRLEAFRLIGRWRMVGSADALLDALGDGNPAVVLAAIQALRRIPEPRIAGRLVPLAASKNDEIALAAIQALGDTGTRESITPLLELTKGFFRASDVRGAAEIAVLRIRRRIGPQETGRLSILAVPDSNGAVSLSEGPGAVSLSDGFGSPSEARRRACPADNAPGLDEDHSSSST